jgi:hypothetical protein
VRVFIDFLVEKMPGLLDAARLDCQDCAKRAVDKPALSPRVAAPASHSPA